MNVNLKLQVFIVILFLLLLTAFFGYKVYRRNYLGRSAGSSQSNRLGNIQEGSIPQSGDLCDGTGGNGQIVSVGKNTITIKRKDDGKNQIVHLADQVTIKISAASGSASESDLKIGDRVTLVGAPNPDGSFTANGVFVCSGN